MFRIIKNFAWIQHILLTFVKMVMALHLLLLHFYKGVMEELEGKTSYISLTLIYEKRQQLCELKTPD